MRQQGKRLDSAAQRPDGGVPKGHAALLCFRRSVLVFRRCGAGHRPGPGRPPVRGPQGSGEARVVTRYFVALLAFALMSSPGTAVAAPATVTVFEAQVHSAPDRSPGHPYVHREQPCVGLRRGDERFQEDWLPNGRVGYIEESALSLSGAAARPPGPPPEGPPPPPPYAAPPPPPPSPPPGAYRYAPYRRAGSPGSTAYRHLGLFLRFDLGLGYAGLLDVCEPDALHLRLESWARRRVRAHDWRAVRENFVVAGEFWSTWAPSPTLLSRGLSVPSGSTFSNALLGIPGLTSPGI